VKQQLARCCCNRVQCLSRWHLWMHRAKVESAVCLWIGKGVPNGVQDLQKLALKLHKMFRPTVVFSKRRKTSTRNETKQEREPPEGSMPATSTRAHLVRTPRTFSTGEPRQFRIFILSQVSTIFLELAQLLRPLIYYGFSRTIF